MKSVFVGLRKRQHMQILACASLQNRVRKKIGMCVLHKLLRRITKIEIIWTLMLMPTPKFGALHLYLVPYFIWYFMARKPFWL